MKGAVILLILLIIFALVISVLYTQNHVITVPTPTVFWEAVNV